MPKKTTINKLASEAATLDPNEQINVPSTNYNIITNSLSAFLAKFKVESGQDFTHTSLGPPYGSYYISNIYIDNFFDLYTRAFKNNIPLHITERHKAFSPILIDLDFKQNTSNRIYDINYIQTFINTLLKILKDFIIYDSLHIYVLEKGKPRKCSSGYKDGIHIVIPDVITCPAIQYEIRNIMISEYSDIITLNEVTNNVEDIYDKSVIQKNNWFLYGSRKPDEEFSWKVTHIYEFDSKSIKEIDVDANADAEEKYIKLLSIRYNVNEENRYSDLGKKIIKYSEKTVSYSIAPSVTASNITNKNELDVVYELINILDKSRADSYDTWSKVGWCLHNIDEYLLPKWIEFSKQSTNYNTGECEKLWDRMKDSGLGIGTLHMWAKQDANQSYIEIMSRLKNKNDLVLLEDIWRSTITYDYKYVKIIFEKTHFKIMNPISYIEVSTDNSDIIRNKLALKEVYNNLYCKLNKDEKNMRFIDIWLADRDIKTFSSVDFCPLPLKCKDNVYNMWKGFKIDKDESESSKDIEPFINHLKILSGDNGLDYLIKWLAQLIQQPGKLIGIALIFLSEEGAGKNIFWDYFSEIIGKEYYYETADPVKDLFGRFCNGRKHKLIIDLDEANSKDTFSNSEVLKNMITSTHFNYEQKGINPIELQNFARIIFTTNNILCAKINDSTRRYVIYETSNKMIGNSKYFKDFADYMNDVRNQKAIIEYLRSIDIENINWIKDRPITETYEALKSVTIDPILKFFANFVEKNFYKKDIIITTNELYNDFILFIRDQLKMKEEVINVFTMRILSCQINKKYCNSDLITTGINRKLNIGKNCQKGFLITFDVLKTYLETKGLTINLYQL